MELFISYSHQDEGYRAELGKHLSALRRQGLITDWHDRKIVPGQEWGREIDAHLESAAIIVLLVSPDFMHSEYCWDREMLRALERHDRGDAVVIPVFIRPVYFEGAPFARVQGLPTDAKPVSTWVNTDEAWVNVVHGIRRVIERFQKAMPVSRSPEARTAGRSNGSPAPNLVTNPASDLGRPERDPGAALNYGDVAVLAAQLYQSGGYSSPRMAWHEAADRLLRTRSLREKGCPRATFLSLCQSGMISGIPTGAYTKSQENHEHALAAVRRLSIDPALANSNPEHLWRLVLDGIEKKHNHQMNVVQALWRAGLIKADGQQGKNATNLGVRKAMLDWLGAEGERMADAFKQVFGESIRPFGSRARKIGGLSDGNEGVQWNLGLDPREGSCWVGVNLEGMQYRDWPIARLIQRELGASTLPTLIRKVGAADPMEIRWKRDYWQAASRPLIDERWIKPTPIFVSRLTDDLWREALNGAAGCLASPQGGRASQEVTLSKGRRRVIGEVTPHLTIAFPSNIPASWLDFLTEGKTRLHPFYDWAVERSSGAEARPAPSEASTDNRVRIITTVFSDLVANRGVLAKPGQIATVLAWINAETLRVRLDHDGRQILLRKVECEPL